MLGECINSLMYGSRLTEFGEAKALNILVDMWCVQATAECPH